MAPYIPYSPKKRLLLHLLFIISHLSVFLSSTTHTLIVGYKFLIPWDDVNEDKFSSGREPFDEETTSSELPGDNVSSSDPLSCSRSAARYSLMAHTICLCLWYCSSCVSSASESRSSASWTAKSARLHFWEVPTWNWPCERGTVLPKVNRG